MKIFTLCLLIPFLNYAQLREVTINVHTPGPDQPEQVYISGSNEQFGNWDPGAVPLDKTGNYSWSRKFTFNDSEFLEFKFTLGTWEQEALDEKNEIADNNVVKVTSDTVLNFTVYNWNTGKKRKVSGQITGKVEYIRNFQGEGIKERDIIIWLPPGYEKSSIRYPVLYAQDGQNIVDPATSSFGTDWQMDEAADTLIRKKEIVPVIIVGLYSTTSRFAEYSDTDSGNAYIKFIAEDLKPLIDRRYRTLPDRDNTAVIGSSMGGLISFMTLWNYPDVFSKAACLSPAFQYTDFDYVEKVRNTPGDKKDVKIYIYNGEAGVDKQLQPGVDNMMEALREQGYEEGKDFYYVKDSEAAHTEAAWGKYFPSILKLFFGKGKSK